MAANFIISKTIYMSKFKCDYCVLNILQLSTNGLHSLINVTHLIFCVSFPGMESNHLSLQKKELALCIVTTLHLKLRPLAADVKISRHPKAGARFGQ